MAQYIAKKLAEEAGISAFNVKSCGVRAKSGGRMEPNARSALKEFGITPRFKTQPISRELVNWANLIIPITAAHKVSIVSQFNCLDKTVTFAEFGGRDVSDPYGMGIEEYRKAAGLIFNDCVLVLRALLKDGKICLKKR